MHVLIVESDAALAEIWKRHLERQGARVTVALTEDHAIDAMIDNQIDVIVLDLVIEGGNALTVADIAQYRMPLVPVIFVTNTSFFSDGSIFRHCANARAFLPSATAPNDLAVMIEHYGHGSPNAHPTPGYAEP